MIRRVIQCFGLIMIGEGVVATIAPSRHLIFWRPAMPGPTKRLTEQFAAKPTLSRFLGAVQAALGIYIALRQVDKEL
jgi:hypothetical protein